MKILIALLLLSSNIFAKENLGKYLSSVISKNISSTNLFSIEDPKNRKLAFWNVDAIIADNMLNRAIFVAYHNKRHTKNILSNSKGSYFTLKDKLGNVISFYLISYTKKQARSLKYKIKNSVSKFEKKKTKYTVIDYLFPKAHAQSAFPNQSCSQFVNGPLDRKNQVMLEQTTSTLSFSSLVPSMFGCLQSAFQGVLDSTVGAAKGVIDFFKDPMAGLNKLAEQFDNMKAFLGDFSNQMKSVWSTLSSLPAEAVINIACNFIGSLGADALLAILTGAGAIKVITSAGRYFSKILKLTSFLKKITRFTKLNSPVDTKILKYISQGKIKDKVLDQMDLLARYNFDKMAYGVAKCAVK